MYVSCILVKHQILTVSFQIIFAFVNNTNVTEDKNHAIIYKMAIVYRSYCRMECSFRMYNQHSNNIKGSVLGRYSAAWPMFKGCSVVGRYSAEWPMFKGCSVVGRYSAEWPMFKGCSVVGRYSAEWPICSSSRTVPPSTRWRYRCSYGRQSNARNTCAPCSRPRLRDST